jgi:hypothetical protein
MDSDSTPRVPYTGSTRVVATWQEFPAFTPPKGADLQKQPPSQGPHSRCI